MTISNKLLLLAPICYLLACHTATYYVIDQKEFKDSLVFSEGRSSNHFQIKKDDYTVIVEVYRLNYRLKLNLLFINSPNSRFVFEPNQIDLQTAAGENIPLVDYHKSHQLPLEIEYKYIFDIGIVMRSAHFRENKNIENLVLLLKATKKNGQQLEIKIPLKYKST